MPEQSTYAELEKQLASMQAELASLKAGERWYRKLFDHMLHEVHVWELVFGEDGEIKTWRLVDANPSALKVWGKTRDEVVGKTTNEIFPETNPVELFLPIVKKIFKEGKPHTWEAYFAPTDQYLHMVSIPMDNFFISTGLDVTKNRKLEEQVHQSEKMKAIGQLAAGVAHDFNNQLAGVLGCADILENRLEDEELKSIAKHIRTSAEKAAALTDKLLAFGRKGKNLSVPIDSHKIIEDVVSIVERSLGAGLTIRTDLKAQPSTIIGDPTQLQNAILNIALNANDALENTPPGKGVITFKTEAVSLDTATMPEATAFNLKPGAYLELTITDNGEGMDKKTLSHIFEPFYTTKSSEKGAGMGLASAYGAIKSHNGAINAVSQVGQGTTFRILLPLISETTDNSQDTLKKGSYDGHARVLLVDDEEVVRCAGTEMLKELGCSVTTCKDGQEALELYKETWQDIDVVMLDLIMPEMDGAETFAEMKAVNPNIRVILSSGYSMEGEVQRLLSEGALAFIPKPYRQVQLGEVLEDVMAAR